MLNSFKTKPTALALAVAGSLTGVAAQAQKPYSMPDGSYISISGTVASPSADDFVLDYGSGTILVEMDDWDNYGDAYGLLDGDKVTVLGRVDDDFFEVSKIEAGSVYVENLNTYFYANSADEESMSIAVDNWVAPMPVTVASMTVRGEVTSVKPEDDAFTMDLGGDKLSIDASSVGYDPLDDKGFQQIDKGDYVSVTGLMNWEFFDGQVFDADVITTLIDEQA